MITGMSVAICENIRAIAYEMLPVSILADEGFFRKKCKRGHFSSYNQIAVLTVIRYQMSIRLIDQ
jgi:hypothetical protein